MFDLKRLLPVQHITETFFKNVIDGSKPGKPYLLSSFKNQSTEEALVACNMRFRRYGSFCVLVQPERKINHEAHIR